MVDAVSPVTVAETGLVGLPLMLPAGVSDPYAVVLPYWKR